MWADHTLNTSAEVGRFIVALGMSVLAGLWSGLVYLGLEPYVRRLWPEIMISWTRLLMGQFGDPRVGRDILLGAVAGVSVIVIQRVSWLVPTWFGAAPRQPYESMVETFLGGPKAWSQVIDPELLIAPLTLLLVLTVLLFALRRKTLAVVGTFAVYVLVDGHWRLDDPSAILLASAIVETLLVWSIVLFTLIRFGLLALVTTFFFFNLLQRWPLILAQPAWFGGTSLTAMVVLVAIAAIAMRVSLGRSPAVLPSP